jgi:hypothetical protein
MDHDLVAVTSELQAREPLFHRTERGTSRADFEAMTTEDFWEVGASGARYDREFVWSTLETRYAVAAPEEWSTDDFACRPLSADTYLVTYRLRQHDRTSRRATTWQLVNGDWRALYHQGTEVAPQHG